MAIRCSSPAAIIPNGHTSNKPVTTAFMVQKSHVPSTKAVPPIKFVAVNKVFEDQVRGIVCYRDDCGELICEGYDEGPRFCPQSSRKIAHQSREIQIPSLLQQSQLWTVGGLDFISIRKGVAVKDEDQDWNAFNRLR